MMKHTSKGYSKLKVESLKLKVLSPGVFSFTWSP